MCEPNKFLCLGLFASMYWFVFVHFANFMKNLGGVEDVVNCYKGTVDENL